LACGLLSQYLRSRLRAIRIFLGMQAIFVLLYLFLPIQSAIHLYGLLVLLGFSAGFWAVFITNAAEQFGTNLRATASGLAPSFVRLFLIPISLSFQFLKSPPVSAGLTGAAAIIGALVLGAAFWASYGLKDSFSTDLDYVEM
jgi:MFS transporter, putative metabolite:H+ symporter